MPPDTSPLLHVRPYVAADRPACLALFASNVPRYFAPEEVAEFEAFLRAPAGDYVVVEREGEVLACGGCYVREGIGRLSWGLVSRAHHGQSLGRALLAWRLQRLWVDHGVSEVAIDTSQHTAGFFARHGFRVTRQLADGFGPGLDLVAMTLRREDWLARADGAAAALRPSSSIDPCA